MQQVMAQRSSTAAQRHLVKVEQQAAKEDVCAGQRRLHLCPPRGCRSAEEARRQPDLHRAHSHLNYSGMHPPTQSTLSSSNMPHASMAHTISTVDLRNKARAAPTQVSI